MAVNYSYGNPAETMDTALQQLKTYYKNIKSPDLIRMEDAYTRDNINSAGQSKLTSALEGYPRNGQIGSSGNRLTMKALRDTVSAAPETYANLIASQREREQEQLSNYINAARAQGNQSHTLGMNDSLFNDRVKQFAEAMAQEKLNRERQLEQDKIKFDNQKYLIDYRNSLINDNRSPWGDIVGGITKGAALALAV